MSSPWEGMLDQAVSQGLGASSPRTAGGSTMAQPKTPAGLDDLFNSPPPKVSLAGPPVPSQQEQEQEQPPLPPEAGATAGSGSGAAIGPHEDALFGVGDALRARVGAATMRSVELLRGEQSGDAERLRAELEAWLLEAGRMEAVVDDALKSAALVLAERDETATQARAEAVACRRALELHLSLIHI